MRDEPQEQMNPETASDIGEGADTPRTPEEEVMHLRATLAQRDEELAEARNAYLRAHADFDNFRKRMRNELAQEFGRGSDKVLAELLPIIDNFERALAAVGECSGVESLAQGVELIYRQLLSLLESNGITLMEVEGQPFDPRFHDAVARVPTAQAEEHTIIGEIQRGYLKNGDTFRPAKVAVAVAPEG